MEIRFADAGVLVDYDAVTGLTTIHVLNGQGQVIGKLQLNMGQVCATRKLLDVLVSTLIELEHVQ